MSILSSLGFLVAFLGAVMLFVNFYNYLFRDSQAAFGWAAIGALMIFLGFAIGAIGKAMNR